MAILEKEGPLSYIDLFLRSDLDCSQNATKYLRRCVAMGYASVDTSVRPRLYAAKPGWRVCVDLPRVIKNKAAKFGAHNPFGCFFADAGSADREALNGNAR